MPRTRIKICGITRPEDAALAAEYGADAVGMVFYPQARRCITLERAREVLAVLPPFVTPVALFVDQSLDAIRGVLDPLGIQHVQLHGDETPELVAALSDRIVLKAIKAHRSTFEPALTRWRRAIAERGLGHLRGLILETPAAAPGGTGIANDWAYLADCRQRGVFVGLPAIIAAGGLTPETVADVVCAVAPAAVDVSSGVERELGQKDPGKMKDLIDAVRAADSRCAG